MAKSPSKWRDFKYQFFRPLAFLSVNGTSLDVYRYILPLVTTVAAVAAAWLLPAGIDLVGDKSVSDYMATFFSTLPGFFIAALAAVVAFGGGDLDRNMPDVSVKITVYGAAVEQSISFRMFLCYLFAYLTILSFLGFFVCVGGSLLAPSVNEWLKFIGSAAVSANWRLVCVIGFTAIVAFISASVVFCTGLGLYFLAERVHQTLLPNSDNQD